MGRLDVHIRHGGGDDGTWAVLALLVALAVIGTAAARHVIAAVLHVVVTVLVVIGWTLAGIAAAAILTGGVLAGVRVRRAVLAARARREVTPRPVIYITPEGHLRPLPDETGPARPALSPPLHHPGTAWPLPGWWEEIRPQIGGDDGEHRRPR